MFFGAAVLLWSQPQDVKLRSHLERAARAKQNGDLKIAAEEYRKALELDTGDAETHARLGMVYQDLGMLPEAIDSLEHALRLNPHLPRVDVLLAFNYIGVGRRRDAIPLLARSFEAEPDLSFRSLAGQRLVECYFGTGDEDKGIATLQKLRQISPDDPNVLYTASKVYANLWNRTVQHMLAKAPESYQVHQVFAEVLEAQEKYAEAANEYRQILKSASEVPGVHYKLGRMILRSDSSAEAEANALAEFRKELDNNPADASALTEIGEIHLKANRFGDAAQAFSRALELQTGYVQSRIGLAKVLIAQKEWPKALQQLEASAKLAPEDESVAYNFMIVYRGLGQADDAKRAFQNFQRLKEQKEQNRSSILNQLKSAPVGRNP